ncbi:HD domain-containing protein [Candidatus Desantisbacteria bacterium]|nr:HD domain-containing protein [Candidatus Desantisbacteria bacterium]
MDEISKLNQELESMTKEISHAYEELSLIYDVSTCMGSVLDVDRLPIEVINKAINILDVRCGFLLLFDEQQSRMTIKAARGFSLEILDKFKGEYLPNNGLSGECVRKKQPIVCQLKEEDKDISETMLEIKNIMCVPMIYKDEPIGVIVLGDKVSGEPFYTPDTKLVFALATMTSTMVQNARLYSQLQNMFLSAISSLSSAIDEKDNYTLGHSNRVTSYAVEIGKRMNLSEERLGIIQLAAILHDVGKIGVPEEILKKTGKLTSEEWGSIKQHPDKGVHIVEPMVATGDATATFGNHLINPKEHIGEIIAGIKYHHERFDGHGYPAGISGTDIPLISRIIAVADAYDAMTSKRSYRDALPEEIAIEELRRNAGEQHDPEIVELFIKMRQEQVSCHE